MIRLTEFAKSTLISAGKFALICLAAGFAWTALWFTCKAVFKF